MIFYNIKEKMTLENIATGEERIVWPGTEYLAFSDKHFRIKKQRTVQQLFDFMAYGHQKKD